MALRSKVAMVMAEFLGTAVLATTVINISRSQIGIGYFVAIGVGLTFGLMTLALADISGAHFNPAITIGKWSVKKIGTLKAISFIAAQMLGGFGAWKLNNYFTGQKLANIAGKSFEWKIIVAEAIGTFLFAFLVAAALYQGFKGLKLSTAVGGGLFMGIIVATVASNGMLNPAVALGAQSWGKAYIFGPIVGAVVGFNLYDMLFSSEKHWLLAWGKSNKRASTVRIRSSATPARKPAQSTKKTAKRRK